MRYPTRGKRFGLGLRTGFPMAGKCQINRSVKVKPIKDFMKNAEYEYMQYIGIAIDEPKRLERLECNKISLLAKYNYTERMAFEKCKEYEMLSPIYDFASRGAAGFVLI